jgi:regulatory protein
MARRKSEPLGRDALMDYAARALAMRAMTAPELRARLVKRAALASDVEDVIARLKEAKALDDRRFAEYYAAARLENQGFGKMRVLRDLRTRRVAGEVAEQVVERTFQGIDETELIEQFLARKFRGVELPAYLAEPKHLMSAFRRLRLAGFSAGASIRALRRYAAEADVLEDME